jgi:1-acyl-sn-glycerol-3-phosphate acyltransferase
VNYVGCGLWPGCWHTLPPAWRPRKEDVRRWPLIGPMAEHVGTIFLHRGERDASSRTAEHMTWALARARAVIVFPEGTTTDEGV